MRKLYDLTYWSRISFDPEEVENEVLELIKNFQGEIVGVSGSQKKQLAYPVERETYGYLNSVYFYADPQKVEKINFELKKFKEILRFLIIKRKVLPKTLSFLKNKLESKEELSIKTEE